MLGLDYACLGGNEITNSERVLSYVRAGWGPNRMRVMGEACPGLYEILEEAGPYADPISDPAPWYDPNVPESGDFAGFLATDVTGAEDSPWTRPVYANVGSGQTLGRLRAKGRVVTYSGVLLGRSCCGVSFGLRWLTAVLTAGDRCAPCEGTDLELLACCPPPMIEDEADCAGASQPAELFRFLKGVGLLEGPNVGNRVGNGCRCGCTETMEVSFTLAAASPFLYAAPRVLLDQVQWITEEGCPIDWVEGSEDCDSSTPLVCVEPEPCDIDPTCDVPPELPVYVTAEDPCLCDPIAEATICVNVDKDTTFGQHFEGVPVLEVYSGSSALRNVTINVYEAPGPGSDCEDLLDDPCQICGTIGIRYVPPFATLRMDGTTRRVTLTCLGQSPVPGDRNLATPFSWPDLGCGDACVCVSSDLLTVADDAWVSLSVVPREGAPLAVAP